MTWFKIDDGWARHPKSRLAGKDGRALWVVAGVECAALDGDGYVPAHMVKDYCFFAEVNARTVPAKLVAAGLWHDASTITACDICFEGDDDWGGTGEIDPGSFFFHQWWEYQIPKAHIDNPGLRTDSAKRKRLSRSTELKQQIRERDRDRCRYCDILCEFDNVNDRRSPRRGTFDHLDPFGPNTLDNLVVACGFHNGRKGRRTPAQWLAEDPEALPLRPPPPPYLYVAGAVPPGTEPPARKPAKNPGQTRSKRDPDPNQPVTKPVTNPGHRDPGSTTDRSQIHETRDKPVTNPIQTRPESDPNQNQIRSEPRVARDSGRDGSVTGFGSDLDRIGHGSVTDPSRVGTGRDGPDSGRVGPGPEGLVSDGKAVDRHGAEGAGSGPVVDGPEPRG